MIVTRVLEAEKRHKLDDSRIGHIGVPERPHIASFVTGNPDGFAHGLAPNALV
jgi:hypothetical protein